MLAHLNALYGFARWLARNPADAEDLVQETMLKGLRARSSFEPGTNLRAWLFTILRRTFLNLDARAGRERPTGLAAPGAEGPPAAERVPEPAVDPEPALFAAVSRDAIDAALDALPPEFREAVWLCDVEELTMSEAAAVIGCPVGTVKSRVSRGRAILRASLKGYAG
jgi:RNA polymerase sigma-70 factor, ECF subfamily